jgi:hypothetical protein
LRGKRRRRYEEKKEGQKEDGEKKRGRRVASLWLLNWMEKGRCQPGMAPVTTSAAP